MIVYQTNPQGVYLGPVQADPSPLEPDVWLIPGGCVETPPPAIPEGMMAVWRGEEWVLSPLPVDVPEPNIETVPPTPEQIIAAFTAAIDAHVETAARAWGYNGAAHLASYVASTVPQWAAEATAFVAWRDQVWLAAMALLADVQAGEAEPPAVPQDFVSTLPPLMRPQVD